MNSHPLLPARLRATEQHSLQAGDGGGDAGEPVLAYWLRGEPTQNFGDFLAVYLFRRAMLGARIDAAAYRLTGSALAEGIIGADLAAVDAAGGGRVAYWGCGMRDEVAPPAEMLGRCDILGVRGPLTRDALGLPGDTILGDPALIVPLVYTPQHRNQPVRPTLCVPHFHDSKGDAALLDRSGADIVVRPRIRASLRAVEDMIDDIANARFVLAGALHAAVIACAYDIPFAFWDNGHVDIPFKWRDFAASIDIPTCFARDVESGGRLYESFLAPAIRKPSLLRLLEACPFHVRPSVLVRALAADGSAPDVDVGPIADALKRTGLESDAYARSGHLSRQRTEQRLRETLQGLALRAGDSERRAGEIEASLQAEQEAARAAVRAHEIRVAELLAAEVRSAASVEETRRKAANDHAARTEELERKLAAARSALHDEHATVQAVQRARAAAEELASQREAMLQAVAASTTWQLLAPLRWLGRSQPRLTRALRPVLRVIWWTVTLQLGYRFVVWRRHRAALAAAQPQRAPTALVAAAPAAASSSAASTPAPAPALATEAGDLRTAFLAWHGSQPIRFPSVADPEVSVIIPAWRGLADLETCLRALAAHRATEPSFEVILVDDCPDAPVLHAIPNSGGLIKVANPENLGFLLTCNRGAAAARGRHLCFLNSDTIVSAGWLRALVSAVDEVPGTALIGGMLLNVDGTIQDAGWRILGNGWGYPIGRNGDPRDGAYTYRRPVDCVTGACFLVPRPIFTELGGLDPIYAPAFYEEFDFAFRARARGLKVMYEPRSRVVHVGSASYGAERRDELSAINHARFTDRFADALRKQPWNTDDEFALRHAAGDGPVLLVLDLDLPQPDRHAGDVTTGGYLSLLAAAGWRVVFGATNGGTEGPAAEAFERQGIELIRAPRSIEAWLEAHGRHVREVWLARPEVAEKLVGLVRTHTEARITYYTHDLHHVRLEREAALRGDPALQAEAELVRAEERGVFLTVDHVASPSVDEADVIERLAPGTPVTVLPAYYYDAEDIRPRDAAHFAALSDVVFVGGFPHIPNVDAALFIANEIMPLVWREQPDARLVLVGYAPPPEVRALAGPRIVVTGQVPSVEPFLDRARVVLAALRYGAGVKGKTVDALRLGVPVVATPIGAEGIGIEPGVEAIVAEGEAALAEGVLALLRDPDRCAALSAAGARLIGRRFSRAAARTAIGRIFRTPRCGVCGSAELIAPPLEGNYRESFVCRNCYALARAEALGRVMVGRLARDGETSLVELANRRPDLQIHEFGFVGGIVDTLRGWRGFSVSEYFDGVPPGTCANGVRCEDLTRLTFADGSFDIVVSQDVMEHVPDPVAAFAETARVLRPGGAHVFTIPHSPNLAQSVTRARLGAGGVEHILPPEYHGDPVRAEGALVFTDFGADLGAMLERVGLQLIEHDVPVLGGTGREVLRVFEAVKPAGDAGLPCCRGFERAEAEGGALPEIAAAQALMLYDLQERAGVFETLIERCYMAELRAGSAAVDGGAHAGLHTAPMARLVGASGRVLAFEPVPHLAAGLRRQFADAPQVSVNEQALSDREGTVSFQHIVNEPSLSSLFKREFGAAYPGLETEELQVGQTTLDRFSDVPVRFIKLDLEGNDYFALLGGREMLARHRPLVAFECGRRQQAELSGYDAEGFFGLFADVDYSLLDLFGRAFGPAEFDLPWNSREVPHYVVAVPRERGDVAGRLRAEAWALVKAGGAEAAREPVVA